MNLKEKVIDMLKNLSGQPDIREEDSLANDLGIDSLGMVTLLVALEEMLSAELEETDMDPFALATVEDVIALAERYAHEN
ncbi:MAG: acyl carrier protein [Clostridia bacterium]|nr:acyl carrier protein [Clostridia bacterium]